MLCELLQKSPALPCQKPALFPPVEEWGALPGAARWIAAGEEALAVPWPALPLSLWLDFTRTGRRAPFEEAYFTRRRLLCALVMAECMERKGRFLPAIDDAAWSLCEESAWQLPAHNSYIRDTPQLPLPDTERPVVDLFAAETGALLSVTLALLGEQLAAAPRLRDEVRRRILTPYRTAHFWWMGDGDEPMCNWTTWCTQNVLLCAAVLEPAGALEPYVRQAAYSIDCFLKDYGEDGCCSEGAQYYRHAGLTLYGALELLCGLVPGVFDAAWRQPKIQNIAEYIVHVHVAGPYYLNFADCSPLAGARGVREYLFGRRVGSASLMALAAHDWTETLRRSDPDRLHHPDTSEGINLWYHLLTALHEPEVLRRAQAAPDSPGDAWYPSVGLLSCRRGGYVLGAKAGCNADSHNHNDVGSVTLYKGGNPLLIDIGVETYSQKTFSPRRYEIWTMQSSWHNLPEFDGRQQQPGGTFRARAVTADADRGGISMDIAPAYGAVPGLGYYRRTVRLGADGLRLADETDYPAPVLLTLMSVEPPAWEGGRLRFGALAEAVLTGAQDVAVEAVPVRDERLRQAWPATLWRTRVRFAGRLELAVH